VLAGGEEEAALAAQVAAIGDIVDGTADIELRYPLVSFIPVVIEKRTDCFHGGLGRF